MKKSCFLFNLLVASFLLITSGVKASPVFTTNPLSASLCVSVDSTTFTATAIDTPGSFTVTYIWYKSSDGGATWSLASGTTYRGDSTATLTVRFGGSTALTGYEYRCVAHDSLTQDSSEAATLVIVATPVAGSITGAALVCDGASTRYSESATGGSWSTSSTSIATIGTSGVLTGMMPGHMNVVYSVSNICGIATASKDSVVVDSIPNAGAVVGLDSICLGGGLSVTNMVSGGVWSSSNTAIATIGTAGDVMSIGAGFDSLKYTVTDFYGCSGVASLLFRVDTNAVPKSLMGATVVCRGDYVILTDSNYYGIQSWSCTNATATVNELGKVTGVSGGFDTILYSFTNACNTVSTSISVEIDTPLAHGSISGPSSLCVGSLIHLSNSVAGGFWLSGSSDASVDGSGNVTGLGMGTATISCLFSNGCGDVASTHVITISAPASAITAMTDSLGIGLTLTLSDATPGGAWSTSDAAVATVNSSTGVATGVAVGTAVLMYTVTNDCGTTSASFTIVVGTVPSAGALTATESTVCVGRVLGITASVSGGTWSTTSSNITLNTTTGSITGISQGNATVSYTVTNPFGTSVATITISVISSPVLHLVGPSAYSIGGDYSFVGVPAGGYWTSSNGAIGYLLISDYTVSHTDTLIAGTEWTSYTYASVALVEDGIDTLHYIYANACGSADSVLILTIGNVTNGVNTITGQANAVTLYPNPNGGTFTVSLNSDITENAHVVITNLLGQQVQEFDMNTNTPSVIKMNEADGVYFLSATAPNGRFFTKFTVAK